MPAPRPRGSDRMTLKAGPLGGAFFDAVEDAAASLDQNMSHYIRVAIMEKMERDGFQIRGQREPVKPKAKKGKR